VFLGSAELAAVCSRAGPYPDARRVPWTPWASSTPMDAASVYRYMNFDQIEEYKEVADTVKA
jgi:aconitate hydratase 2 / 2-methylisocitrate dehydratase